MPIRVLVVEDDDATRRVFSDAVDASDKLELVAALGDLKSAYEALGSESDPIDVLLLDLQLGNQSGLPLIGRCKQQHAAQVIVISVLGDEATVIRAIEAGADGYILKRDAFMAIEPAIRRVMDNGSPVSPSVARYLLKRFHTAKPDESETEPRVLTGREQQILEELACGLTYKEVAERHCLSYHTVSAHVKSTYRKLNVNSRGEAVAKGLRSGLISID